jgi:uncharacterized protein YraI
MRMMPGMTAAAFVAAAATMVLPALAQQEPPTVEQSPAASGPSRPQQGASPSDVSPPGSPPPRSAIEAQQPEAVPGSSARFAVVTANVHLRSGPSTDAEVLVTIPAGSRVEVTDCSEWCMVTWKAQSGFAIARNVGARRQGRAQRTAPRYAGAPAVAGPSGLNEPPVVYETLGGEMSGDSNRDKSVKRGAR